MCRSVREDGLGSGFVVFHSLRCTFLEEEEVCAINPSSRSEVHVGAKQVTIVFRRVSKVVEG